MSNFSLTVYAKFNMILHYEYILWIGLLPCKQ